MAWLTGNDITVDTLVQAFDILKPKIESLEFTNLNITRTTNKSWRTFIMDMCLGIIPIIAGGVLIKHVTDRMDPDYAKKQQAATINKQLMNKLYSSGRKLSSPLDSYEQQILSDVLLSNTINITFNDIGGLDTIKDELYETVILPLQSPELYTNLSHHSNNNSNPTISNSLLSSPRGVLFYGPPGTGKTMMAKAIASTCSATFINIRLSTLQNKWFGESQKLIRAVFSLAYKLAPTIIFIDEIDLFMSKRTGTDHEASGTMKSEFMSLWDGLTTDNSTQVTVLGCTNRPFDIDEAILRRMPRSFLFDLPDINQRMDILNVLLRDQLLDKESINIHQLAELTVKYSGSDLKELCRYAAMRPVRELLKAKKHSHNINNFTNNIPSTATISTANDKPRAIQWSDFMDALHNVEPTGHSAMEYSRNFQSYHNSNNRPSSTDNNKSYQNQTDSIVDKFMDYVAKSNNSTPVQPNGSRTKSTPINQNNTTSSIHVD